MAGKLLRPWWEGLAYTAFCVMWGMLLGELLSYSWPGYYYTSFFVPPNLLIREWALVVVTLMSIDAGVVYALKRRRLKLIPVTFWYKPEKRRPPDV